jgi:hypothetical protein
MCFFNFYWLINNNHNQIPRENTNVGLVALHVKKFDICYFTKIWKSLIQMLYGKYIFSMAQTNQALGIAFVPET